MMYASMREMWVLCKELSCVVMLCSALLAFVYVFASEWCCCVTKDTRERWLCELIIK